ncbi:manganese efflux pump [Aminipila butyrica]|uniref:Putative manganese efflux pump MntP n=1 Tax=Aminipila butyrica TaxID=433296 RepID=A0A858BTF4_9FIRM|nr:manganese efflux pump MntP family protein [Aminipila butyrica]QIB68358.1 manganese efflux pump [Aminipila butyrica]
MAVAEIMLIGAGLAMDAVAVAMTNGMVYKGLRRRHCLAMPLLFGLFQALMPLLGYGAGSLFSDFISRYAGIVIFVILGVIGGKMLKEGMEHWRISKGVCPVNHLSLSILFFQAVATSIDAFAVGVGFSAMRVNILEAVVIIAVVTAILTMSAIFIGRKFGDILGCQAEMLGGIILMLIGIKAII